MSGWGWRPERDLGIWRHGPAWLRPFASAVPWLTVGLLMLMMVVISGTLTGAKGVLFDLPRTRLEEGEATSLVALAMPVPHATLVFFDDARYTLEDSVSTAALGDHLADRIAKVPRKTLLVLADRRVTGGALMKLADIARRGGAERILFAENGSKGDVAP